MRKYLRNCLSVLAAAVLMPFLQAPAAKFAETIGFDTVYSSKWETVTTMVSNWTHNFWYIATTSFIAGAAVSLWLSLLFPEKKKNKVSCTVETKAAIPQFTYDDDKPLTPIVGKRYRNEKVVLDGFHYIKCEFNNVTFVYDGVAGVGLQNCSFTGIWTETNNMSVNAGWLLFRALGFMRDDIAMDADPRLNVESPKRFRYAQPKGFPGALPPTPTPPAPPAGTSPQTSL